MKSHIEAIYKDTYSSTGNSSRYAHLITRFSNDSLSGIRFINELIQNADDAKSEEIKIEFLEDILIFSHSGEIFDSDDVTQLCDTGNPKRKKIVDPNSIGEKGIGFKAVFTVSDTVYIRSGESSFCFDKNHREWKDNSEETPWQIIPIWRDFNSISNAKLKVAISQADRTYFCIKLNDSNIKRNEVIAYLKENAGDGRLLLFLHNIKNIVVKNNHEEYENIFSLQQSEETFPPESHLKKWIVSSSNSSSSAPKIEWIKYSINVTLGDDIKNKLKEYKGQVSEKYLNATVQRIELAIKIENDEIVDVKSIPLSCYLPTEEKMGFPFLVNASWMLDIGRSHLNEQSYAKLWNDNLLRMLYYFHCKFLQYISTYTPYWKDVLTLLATPNPNKNFTGEMLSAGIKKYPFIKTMNGAIKTIPECIIDEYSFVQYFGTNELKSKAPDNKIKELDKLNDFKLSVVFDIPKIIAEIKKAAFSKLMLNPRNNYIFIWWVSTFAESIDQSKELLTLLKDSPIILGHDKALHCGKDLFFTSDKFKFHLDKFNFVQYVHPVLDEAATKDKKKQQSMAKYNKVKSLSLTEIIKLANDNPSVLPSFTSRLFSLREKFKKEDYQAIRELKLLTANGAFVEAHKCYLPDSLRPVFPLQESSPNFPACVKLEEYYAENKSEDSSDTNAWQNFLLNLSVQFTLMPSNIANIIGHMHQTRQVIHFTCMLYMYSKSEDGKKFIVDRDAQKELRKLPLLTKSDKYLEASAIYLADVYLPDMQLEAYVPELDYLSPIYLESLGAIELSGLRGFLEFLGIKGKIELKLLKDKQRSNEEIESEKYCKFLESLSFTGDINELYPSITSGYKYSQHKISHYWHFDFSDKIVKTPLFWQLIKQNWSLIKENLSKVTYTTARSCQRIPSNLEWLALRAMSNEFLNHNQNESEFILQSVSPYPYSSLPIYAPTLSSLFQEFSEHLSLPIYNNEYLQAEQIRAFKLNETLSLADCIKILDKIGNSTAPTNVKKKIEKIYQCIAYYKDELVNEYPLSMKLLTTKLDFQHPAALIGLDSPYIELPANSLLLRTFTDLDPFEFKLVCEKLGVNYISHNALEISTDNAEIFVKIKDALIKSIRFLALYESNKREIADEDEIIAHIKEFTSRANQLEIISSDSIILTYGAFLWKVDYWFNEDTKKLYLLSSINEAILIKSLCNVICKTWNLKSDSGQLWEILLDDNSRKCSKLLSIGITEEQLNTYLESDYADSDEMKDEKSSTASNITAVLTDPSLELSSTRIMINLECFTQRSFASPRSLFSERGQQHDSENGEKVVSPNNSNNETLEDRLVSNVPLTRTTQISPQISTPTVSSPTKRPYTTTPGKATVDYGNKLQRITENNNDHTKGCPLSSQQTSSLDKEEVKNTPPYTTSSTSSRITSALISSTSSSSQPSNFQRINLPSMLSLKERMELGHLGEEKVYDYLREKYKNKYGDNFSENDEGFTIIKSNGETKKLTWCNKDYTGEEDSGNPYDMIITVKKNGYVKTRYIEVKSSIRQNDISPQFSEAEWGHFEKSKNDPRLFGYALYIVTNVNSDSGIKKFSGDALTRIMEGKNNFVKNYKQLNFTTDILTNSKSTI